MYKLGFWIIRRYVRSHVNMLEVKTLIKCLFSLANIYLTKMEEFSNLSRINILEWRIMECSFYAHCCRLPKNVCYKVKVTMTSCLPINRV